MKESSESTRRWAGANSGGSRSLLIAASLLMLSGLAASTFVWRPADLGRARAVAASEPKRYDLTGVVMSVDQPNRSAMINHEKVGDYMPAMTMAYAIKDHRALREMRAGDNIKATMVVTHAGEMWLENVVITSGAAGR